MEGDAPSALFGYLVFSLYFTKRERQNTQRAQGVPLREEVIRLSEFFFDCDTDSDPDPD
jgi:hypothetical protein